MTKADQLLTKADLFPASVNLLYLTVEQMTTADATQQNKRAFTLTQDMGFLGNPPVLYVA